MALVKVQFPNASRPMWVNVGGDPICPDLLRLEQIGAADNLRGRVVRTFFRLLDVFMPVRP